LLFYGWKPYSQFSNRAGNETLFLLPAPFISVKNKTGIVKLTLNFIRRYDCRMRFRKCCHCIQTKNRLSRFSPLTGLPEISVQATIYRNGKPAYEFSSRKIELSTNADAKRFDYVGRLRLNDFPPGEYLLRLVVTDGLAKKKFRHAEQWMDFSVK
jgi:hypothetical protein